MKTGDLIKIANTDMVFRVAEISDIVVLQYASGTLHFGDMASYVVAKEAFDLTYNKKTNTFDAKNIVYPKLTVEQAREKEYEKRIPRAMLDAFLSYTAEGDTKKAGEIAKQIAAIKKQIRAEIPDDTGQ